jgi:hypothetical protein
MITKTCLKMTANYPRETNFNFLHADFSVLKLDECLHLYTVACKRVAGNDLETNETTAIARQQFRKYAIAHNNGSSVGSDIFYVVCSEAISLDRPSTVGYSGVK